MVVETFAGASSALAGGPPGSLEQRHPYWQHCRLYATTVENIVTEQAVMGQPQQGEMVGLVNMLVDRVTVQETQVGIEINCLRCHGHNQGQGRTLHGQ